MVLSDRAQRRLARVRDARSEHLRRHGREPSSGDIAASTGSPPTVEAWSRRAHPARDEEPVAGERRVPGTLEDVISDPRAEDEYEDVWPLEVEQVPASSRASNDRER